MQGTPITAGEERHIPWDMPTLPERLKELNYSTHLVGKWHIGSAYRNATPTRRGFDSHYGYWNGYIGYFDHTTGAPVSFFSRECNITKYYYRLFIIFIFLFGVISKLIFNFQSSCGLDMHNNFDPDYNTVSQYATDLFTNRATSIINGHDYKTPLFLLISHLAPHTGKYDEKYGQTILEERNTDEMNRVFGYIKDIKRRRYVGNIIYMN